MKSKNRVARWLWAAIAVGCVLILAVSATASTVNKAGNGAGDEGILEVGVEYINDFHGIAPYLGLTDNDALSLYSRLGNCGWTRRFAYGNDQAWETDWKGSDKPGGHGQENTYADSVDLAYISTHGGPDSVLFGSTHDDHYLNTADCRLNWGDWDAEWIGLSSCLSMQTEASRRNWAWCMDGLHLIMGFETTMADVNHGDWFGYYLCNGYNMTQAWFRAADALQPQGKVAGVIAEESAHFGDRPGVSVAADTWDMDYYYWRHPVGSEPARYVDVNALGGVMPVFRTKPLGLAITATWRNLGQSFGVSTTTALDKPLLAAGTEAEPVWVSPDKQLEMDPSGGLYAFTNLQRLWTSPTMATKAGVYPLAAQDAITVANSFLTTNGLMPADAHFYEVASDIIDTQVYTPQLGMTRGDAQVVASQPAAYEVIYSRILTYTSAAKSASAPATTVEVSVIGPGAKLKVFVDPNAAALSSMKGAASGVIGGVGGWRQLASSAASQPSAVETVSILSPTQITSLFAALEPIVALSYTPLPYTSRQVTTYTVAYYEGAIGESQAELIPSYVLNVSYTLKSGEAITGPVYIPANQTYMAPLALITPTAQLSASVRIGQQVAFTAADASAPLSSLGYDASLNFALGSGGPYAYNWYVGTTEGTSLGTGRVFTYTASLSGTTAGRTTQNIILEVEDLGASSGNNVSVANYQLQVAPPVYLPLLLRN